MVEGRAGQGRRSQPGKPPLNDGWVLTQKGILWIHRNRQNFDSLEKSGAIKEHRQKILRKLKRIRNHRLFTQYITNLDAFHPMIGDIAELLNCRVDAEQDIWQGRFEKLRREATSADQNDVLDFVERCADAYLHQK